MRLFGPARARLLVGIAAALSFAAAWQPAAQESLHRQSRRVMGTLATVQVHHPDARVAAVAMTAALNEMDRVNGLLSNYDPDTELSRMNREAASRPFRASEELYAFVERSHAYFHETRGTFDPTFGPVVRAWGFFTPRPARPTEADARAARERSGFDKVRLDQDARTVSFAVGGLEFDPGGIGKGYAADRAAAVLRASGITSALVSAGGSTVYALGRPPGQEGWKVSVRDPAKPAVSLRVVTLRDSAVSTSGVSDKFVFIDGRKYGHIIDPRTGEPSAGMCQVSVLAPNATDSDALTKAAFLLPREALSDVLSRRKETHALRVEGTCDQGVVWTTPWSVEMFR